MERRPYVAVVDDDMGMCRALTRLLHSSHVDVATFQLGREILDDLKWRKPDCIVMDLGLPDFMGLDLLDSIQKTYPKIPIVMITAWEDDGLRNLALSRGISGFFYKPFCDDIFLSTIWAAMAGEYIDPGQSEDVSDDDGRAGPN